MPTCTSLTDKSTSTPKFIVLPNPLDYQFDVNGAFSFHNSSDKLRDAAGTPREGHGALKTGAGQP